MLAGIIRGRLASPRTILVLLFAGYALLAYRTAWMSDDAMITLRTASNWLAGYGLTWNTAERVQTYTHPLWMVLVTGAHALTGEPFYSTLYLSLALSCAAVFVLCVAGPGGVFERVIAIVVLSMSTAFVDFSSSGLENPLTHLWLAWFVRALLAHDGSRSALPLYALASAGAVIRFDVALLCAPAVLLLLMGEPPKRAVLGALLASAPALAWLAFSAIYYGFPFPNTAYAKLGLGAVVAPGRLQAGLADMAQSLRQDPLTLTATLAIAAFILARGDRLRRALVAGALLYLAYMLRIGGDFMVGRFLSAPLFLCVACLATSTDLLPQRARWLALAAALGVPFLGQTPPALTGADFGADYKMKANQAHDVRAVFFPIASLTHTPVFTREPPSHGWAQAGLELERAARDPAQRVHVVDALGFAGYYAGPRAHIVDHWALADALLARLPALEGTRGHYTRAIPDGYLETLAGGTNVIQEQSIARYYALLSSVVRGPIWSKARMRAIWTLNTGGLQPLSAQRAYMRARSFEVALELENPTDHPIVVVHAWNEGRRTAYRLDEHSQRGKRYALRFAVDASGARIVPGSLTPVAMLRTGPAPQRIDSFEGLRERGLLNFSAIFEATAPPSFDVYDLRFGYRIADDELLVVRQGLRLTAIDFPNRGWHSGPLGRALRVQWSEQQR